MPDGTGDSGNRQSGRESHGKTGEAASLRPLRGLRLRLCCRRRHGPPKVTSSSASARSRTRLAAPAWPIPRTPCRWRSTRQASSAWASSSRSAPGCSCPIAAIRPMGTGFIAPGAGGSARSTAPITSSSCRTWPIAGRSTQIPRFGVVLYGNGGMNTTYKNVFNAACGGAGAGVFCGGNAGVDLMQAFLSVDYARRMGNVSFGIAPTLAVQRFAARGLGAFAGFSSDPAIADQQRLRLVGRRRSARRPSDRRYQAASSRSFPGQTKMWMTKFDKYSGLFRRSGRLRHPGLGHRRSRL